MTFSLLLAALVMAGVGGWIGRRQQLAGRIMMGLAGAGFIVVIALQVRQNLVPAKSTGRNRYQMAASYGLANCLLRDLAGQSGKVILLFPARRAMDADTEESFENGFVPALRHGHGKLSLKAVHLEGPSKDVSTFKQALAQEQDAIAVISYAGAPVGIEALFVAGQANTPLFYVFDGDGGTNWLGALKEGLIKAVVLPRPGADLGGRERVAGMPDTIFEQFYLLATSANADEIAANLKK